MTNPERTTDRRPLEPDEHLALDRLGEALANVIDRGIDLATLPVLFRDLCTAAKDALEAFGEDWSDEAEP